MLYTSSQCLTRLVSLLMVSRSRSRPRRWIGISGDIGNIFDGPDKSLVSKEWIAESIQIGPLGAKYPTYKFIMEGDTPAYLGLIPVSHLFHRLADAGW
jgi:hypothetical protein